MTFEQSKKLKIGDRVVWASNQDDEGEVVAVNDHAVEIIWPKAMQRGWIDFRCTHAVSLNMHGGMIYVYHAEHGRGLEHVSKLEAAAKNGWIPGKGYVAFSSLNIERGTPVAETCK